MKIFTTLMMLSLAITASTKTPELTVTVSNALNQARTDAPVIVDLHRQGVQPSSALVRDDHGKEIACQLNDLDLDGIFDELCFVADLDGKQTRQFSVTFDDGPQHAYPARVFTEMLMRNDKVKEKNKHNNFLQSITARGDCANSYNLLHHHGVAFESELNGIRIYFDKRQTVDLYGKFQKRLELQATQFYTSDQQKQEGYGDDVLWVGNTFGLGAFRGWNGQEPTMVDPVALRTQRVVAYGPVCTIVEVEDRGWVADATLPPVNMTLRYRQWAGHRDTDVEVFFSDNVDRYRFSTGIINVKGSSEFSDHQGLRACWGTDYPSTDTLKWKRETVGLAILLDKANIDRELPANKDNYAFVVKTKGAHMSYKINYCSANESFGYHSASEWFSYLKAWRREVASPLRITVKK